MRKSQMFEYLRELKMHDFRKCKSIPVVWFSVSLEILSLRKMNSLTTLCNNLDVEAGGRMTALPIFPGLKRMELIDLPSLEMCAENRVGEPSDSLVTIPVLEKLTIQKLPQACKYSNDPHCKRIGNIWSSQYCSRFSLYEHPFGLLAISRRVNSWVSGRHSHVAARRLAKRK
uniref:Uncharacterized protein n=1 Tax=Triticum urartu TaxID=4572 RepID=A0A8R7UWZ7_TRIUA